MRTELIIDRSNFFFFGGGNYLSFHANDVGDGHDGDRRLRRRVRWYLFLANSSIVPWSSLSLSLSPFFSYSPPAFVYTYSPTYARMPPLGGRLLFPFFFLP